MYTNIIFKKCSYACAHHCAEMSCTTLQRTLLIIFPSYPPENHHNLDNVYWREGDLQVRKCNINEKASSNILHHHNRFTALFPGEPVPEENFWTLWCKGILTEADTPIIRLGATLSGLGKQCPPPSSPHFFTGRMPFLPPNQQYQSTEGN